MEKNYRAELVGVLGDPVDGNPTGVVEEAAFQARGLNYRYMILKVTPDGFDDAIKGLKAMHFKGINLTMPHKLAILPYLDEMSEAARIIGAVNTVNIFPDGRLWGDNTDGKGFVEALERENIFPADKNITLLGAGGAAKAIAVECALAGALSVTVINRNEERGLILRDTIRNHTSAASEYIPWDASPKIPVSTDILIQGTSVGLFPNQHGKPDIDYSTITSDMICTDVVFNPEETTFLKECKKIGCRTVSGLGMLVCQGARNFTIWTGEDAPYEVMYEALKKEFQ